MRQTWVCRLLPAVFVLALAAPLHGQSFGFAWWKDAQFQQELALSADQSARIDAIFQAAISQLRPKKEELDKQEELLSQLIAAGADEALVTRQVDKVEAIRVAHEQDADADAAEGASGAVARSAGQVEQAARTVGTRSQAAVTTETSSNGETGNDTERFDLDAHRGARAARASPRPRARSRSPKRAFAN